MQYANVCNITSWERLKRDNERYWAAAELWEDDGASYHLNDLIMDDELMAPAVIVADFSPQVAEWVGSALGRHVQVVGPTRFSQSVISRASGVTTR
jgi:pyruvate dehydrogenase complex dehydrogenase (E1) component